MKTRYFIAERVYFPNQYCTRFWKISGENITYFNIISGGVCWCPSRYSLIKEIKENYPNSREIDLHELALEISLLT